MPLAAADRVRRNTPPELNERIRAQTERRISYYSAQGPEAIEQRLRELDREWDVERWVETVGPGVSLFGLGLGTISRRWLLLPVMVQSFFLQHALQGWCPPLVVLRRLGIRTAREIDEERYALKALRGDFRMLDAQVTFDPSMIDEAAEAAR